MITQTFLFAIGPDTKSRQKLTCSGKDVSNGQRFNPSSVFWKAVFIRTRQLFT